MRIVTKQIRKNSIQVREHTYITVREHKRKYYLTKLKPIASKARKMIEIENTLFHYFSMLEVYGRDKIDNKFLRDLKSLLEDNL